MNHHQSPYCLFPALPPRLPSSATGENDSPADFCLAINTIVEKECYSYLKGCLAFLWSPYALLLVHIPRPRSWSFMIAKSIPQGIPLHHTREPCQACYRQVCCQSTTSRTCVVTFCIVFVLNVRFFLLHDCLLKLTPAL